MFVKAAERAKTGNDELKEDVAATAADKNKRHEIRQSNFKKEIGRAHVTRTDAAARTCRMMQRMAEQLHQFRPMQNAAMRGILNDVVPNPHRKEADDEAQG